MSFGIYIHIPYCLSKCNYCDFHSQGGSQRISDAYIQQVLFQLKKYQTRRPNTVYFGGGTPSLLKPDQIYQILCQINPLSDAEITLEANPETLYQEKLNNFYQVGVNRLSLGIQTASQKSLQTLGRVHTIQQSQKAFEMALQAGFKNISGDIMLALPNYTKQEFDYTLSLIQQGGATHISAYLLKIEPNTAFFKNPPANLPCEDTAADFYLYAVEQLEKAGYQQYEISNFAKKGYQSQHNLLYWDCYDYLGIGPAAHSCLNGIRYAFDNNTPAFLQGKLQLETTGDCTWQDYVMLQLRLNHGLSFSLLKEKYNITFSQKQFEFLQQCNKHGLVQLSSDRAWLTVQGMLIQNSILTELLQEN